MSPIFDHVDDTNHAELAQYARQYDFPDFVKKADLEVATKPPADLAKTAYADPRRSRYPCHTAASTWLSHLFFAEKQAQHHPTSANVIRQRLDSAAEFWSIKAATDAITARKDALVKAASAQEPDTDFAFVWTDDSGNRQRQLRIVTPLEVKTAAEWLLQFRSSIPFADRNTMASKILVKAAACGAALSEDLEIFLERQAGRGLPDPVAIVAMVRDRSRVASDQGIKAGLDKLAGGLSVIPPAAFTPDVLIKLATTIDSFDRTQQLTHSRMLPAPEDVIFKLTLKEANAGMHNVVATTTGRVYDKTAFSRIQLSDVRKLMGDDFAEEISHGLDVDPEKMAEQLQTLPRNDAEVFEQLLHDAGIPQITLKSAAAPRWIPESVRQAAAQAYAQR